MWSELDKMKMRLGFQVLFHNLWMTAVILAGAFLAGVLKEAVILFLAYGLLKINAGGIHFRTSGACILATGTFIIGGSLLSDYLEFPFYGVVCTYVVFMVILWFIGPQGTENNPITEENYGKLRRNTILLSAAYLLLTVCMYLLSGQIPYLLLIAVFFETVSLFPYEIKALLRDS